ncbi:Fic family protein [Desulfobaculum bizertense]|uniref:Fic family protein n=1 Tax=Desulfobaculum bizertense DSM 18034 TaxID=1121442 RepID=A0A1T4X4M1_9BACT|nr:Fic family protein [Desulfobaculum bizertense]SKA84593.1 Fic family protein [Desulfobaculum bizertense DSM 18034]
MVAKPVTKKHLTHKTGKFIFSCEYDEQVISPKIIESRILYSTVSELPILPHIAAKLREDIIKRSIFGTAAIEGNSLSEDEVGALLTADDALKLEGRSELEIGNLKALYALLDGEKQGFWGVTEDFIRDVHRTLTRGIEYFHNSPGNYRNEPVFVGNADHGGRYTPPKTLDDIQTLMGIFVEWMNSEEMTGLDPMIRAALAHFHLAKIHPFQDGNGRSSRFVEAMILDQAGIKYLPQMMSNFYYRNIDEYFIAFSRVIKSKHPEDVTPFLSFYFDGIISSLKEIKEHVTLSIRRLSLKDYYHTLHREKELSQRQLDLLLIALETMLEFSLNDVFSHPVLRALYGGVSVATARRDLKKLKEMGLLLSRSDGKYYRVNMLRLG